MIKIKSLNRHFGDLYNDHASMEFNMVGDDTPKFFGVIVRNNDINKALKELKKKVYRERILIEYRQRMNYEKPSEKRRRKRAEARLRLKKEQQEMALDNW
jgi:ribosomal protein S21